MRYSVLCLKNIYLIYIPMRYSLFSVIPQKYMPQIYPYEVFSAITQKKIK